MAHFDVFNGDADGLCALHQLRLAAPMASVLVTGVKRDIALLQRVDAQAGDSVSVLDVSVDANRVALVALLARGVRIEYFDHHYAGELPRHPNFTSVIDVSAEVCTGILVDRHLGGRHRPWAVVAAFGDNLVREAEALAASLDLAPLQRDTLRALGEALAYNGYGDAEADLVVHPATLYRALRPYADPLEFVRVESIYRTLRDSQCADLERARGIAPAYDFPRACVHVLPDEPWSRRVRGVLANELANRDPGRVHAVVTPNAGGGYTVSVRTPRALAIDADALCRKYATGGGRAGAAGINHLPRERLDELARDLASACG